ncbi:MAG: hypothetical protein COB67_11075 [SAR324 cluster bacterium]|uniref:Histidine kinase domain-containing protein n=1 Tax=SAR324 cluster bacterium TaxID=2024889 RepID=A0A2A4SV72_9DELT|nr:MAG: hypothetical protein COB67_11075 [SAR324 cluster bacterium]
MVSINKLNRPKIYTESDQILNDLSAELADLKSRIGFLEEEQEQSRDMLEELSFQRELSNTLIEGHQEETKQNRENFTVIADVMHNLKSPVSNVVDNLADIIAEIDDQETQETLRECMETASTVLDTFNAVEEFCIDAGGYQQATQETVDIRLFFREIITKIQALPEIKLHHSLRLLMDRNVPQQGPLYTESISLCLNSLIKELQANLPSGQITVIVSREKSEEKYGIELSDLEIEIKASPETQLEWNESWVDSIQLNQGQLVNSGFNLLKIRDLLRKTGGELEVKQSQNKVSGFKFCLPLTY